MNDERLAFEKFIKGSLCSRNEYLLARSYYEQASLEEKELYLIVIKILGRKYFEAIANNKIAHFNNFMRRKGMAQEDAFYCIQKYLNQVTDVDKVLVYIAYKYQNVDAFLASMFLRFKDCAWDKEKIQSLAEEYFISYDMLLKLIDVYLNRYNNQDLTMAEVNKIIAASEEYKKIVNGKKGDLKQASWYFDSYASEEDKRLGNKFLRKEKNKSTTAKKAIKHQKVCLMLLNDIPFLDIHNYVNANHVSMKFVSEEYVDLFLQEIGFDDKDKITYLREKLLQRIAEFKAFEETFLKKSFTFTDNDLLEAKAFVTNYVYGNMNYDTFVKLVGKRKLFYYLSILEISDERLYNLYLARNGQKKFVISRSEITTFIENLKDENQEIDILDYYMGIGIPLQNLIGLLRNFEPQEAYILEDFVLDNEAKNYSLKKIKSLAMDLNNGEILDYLIRNDIPVNDKTIEAVQNRKLQLLQIV